MHAPRLFRVFHAARDASVTGQCERNHGHVGMYRLRFWNGGRGHRSAPAAMAAAASKQNGFRLLNAFGASKRIGETDPQPTVSGSTFTGWLATAATMSVSRPPCRGRRVRPRPRYGSCPLAQSLRAPAPQHRTFPVQDSHLRQGHAFANRLSRDWRLLEEEKHRLCSYPDDQEKRAAVTTAYPGLPQTVKPSRILSVTG
jgi:hypothetical protein